jgi:hypothetical protein
MSVHEVMDRCGSLCWIAAIIAEIDPSDGKNSPIDVKAERDPPISLSCQNCNTGVHSNV